MTTTTTPNVSPGLSDRGVRDVSGDEPIHRAPATAAGPRDLRDLRDPALGERREPALDAPAGPVDVAGVRTAEWAPGGVHGVPKAAIGVLGAALVGGVALAIVLIGPGDKVVKPASQSVAMAPAAPGPAASAATADPTVNNAIEQMNQQPSAAGPGAAAAAQDASAAGDASTPAVPAAQATPPAPAPATARAEKGGKPTQRPTHHAAATQAPPPAAAATGDQAVATPSTTPQPSQPPAPAMQQTPAAPTVNADTPPAPAPEPGATPAPAPSQDDQ